MPAQAGIAIDRATPSNRPPTRDPHVRQLRATHPITALAGVAPNWQAMLRHGLEAAGVEHAGEALAEAIEARLRTGRPLAVEAWIEHHEAAIGRPLKPSRRGPKPKEADDGRN